MADAVAAGDGAQEMAQQMAQQTAEGAGQAAGRPDTASEPGSDGPADESAGGAAGGLADDATEEPVAQTVAGVAESEIADPEVAGAGIPASETTDSTAAGADTAVADAAQPETAQSPAAQSHQDPEPAALPQPPVAPAQAVFSAVAAASFVPPEPPATRFPLTVAGRQLDRRTALIAGGVGVVVIGGAVAALASSGGSGTSPVAGATGQAGFTGGGKASSAPSVPLPTITTNPADGASGVDPSKPVTVKVLGGTIDSVQLSGQEQTSGTLSSDRTTWTSDNALNVNTGYQLTVVAKNSAGKTKSATVSFHTLHPSATFGVSSVVPPRGSTVGVGQPIRVTFSNYVPTEYHAALEQACVVKTEPPVAGAWYWVSNSGDGAILDWRPQDFWAPGTKVSVNFNLNGVRLGRHQFGVKDYTPHEFSIRDTDLRLIVDKDKFSATCYRNGTAIRTFPIDTGMTSAETFVTYTGTMAVLGKGNPVEMKGNYGPTDTYDDFVNWATQITWSGTYVHAAPWDSEIGHANDDSHGCVHCSTTDAKWFYNIVQTGDVVTIKGSRKRPVAVSNGICTFTLDWATLLKGSAYGPTLNGKPVTA